MHRSLTTFLSMEWSEMLSSMPRDRYDYVRALAVLQAAHPKITLKAEDASVLESRIKRMNYGSGTLKAQCARYRRLVAANEDTKPVEAEIIFLAGWLWTLCRGRRAATA